MCSIQKVKLVHRRPGEPGVMTCSLSLIHAYVDLPSGEREYTYISVHGHACRGVLE